MDDHETALELLRPRLQDLVFGFHLRGEAELIAALGPLDPARLLAGGDWEAVFGINLLCRAGDFSQLERVVAILAPTRDGLLWSAAAQLLGFAGSWPLILRAYDTLERSNPPGAPGTRYHLAFLLGASCDRRALDPLLDLLRRSIDANDEEGRDQTLRELSFLLAPTDGNPVFGARDDDPPSHARVVELVAAYRPAIAGLEGNTLFEGERLDLVRVATRLRGQVDTTNIVGERFARRGEVLGAAAGIDFTRIVDASGWLQQLTARTVLDGFIERPPPGLVPGQRGFFGHPIEG